MRIYSGKPRVSGPINNATERFKSEVCGVSVPLVLIDGQELAKHIYNYSLGMQTEQVFEIKGLDGDFWDEMLNEDTRGEEVS